MISTIIFDLSEVLLGGMYQVEEKIAKLSGKPVDPDYLYVQSETQEFFHGKISEDTFWQKIIEKNDWGLGIPTLKELVRSQMVEIEGTREIIRALKEQKYQLGLLSVHTREWVEHCESKYQYHQYFHKTMYSYEVGVSKPDPQAFTLLLDALGARPKESLFIDDSRRNLATAKNLGLHTIHFQNAGKLKAELKKRKIRI